MIDGHKFQYRGATGHDFETFWDDRMTGTVEIFKYITDLFQYPRIKSILISKPYPIRPLYEWIAEKYNGKVEEWSISVKDRSQVYWFDLNFETYRLCFDPAKWLNLDDVIKLSSQSITLHFDSTSLTSEDVNGFLKHWIQTTHLTKMRYLFLYAGEDYFYDIDVILSGIKHTPAGALLDHPFKEFITVWGTVRVDVDFFRTKTGFTIQRNNGEMASIFFRPWLSTTFEMIIH
ncbi:hypothetical protein CAEBREN_13303 [Caenorhabditis brenneri]|uniref:Sdz-33 F-box domain-containing protein n=1 Tax=Caenorhabditis brenneri TaxID=135651 RepID=G0MBX3_CAEBE|nr:hypothetical protein CAEBREN_13303 [Caenorhabditis brenneri]